MSKRATTESFFAPCPRGLERVLAEELIQLGAMEPNATPGGVSFRGDWSVCYQANLHSRVASRVLWKVAASSYRSEEDVYRLAVEQPWAVWFGEHRTIAVRVSAQNCPLKSLDFATLRIKDAVCDKFRKSGKRRPDVNTVNPDIRIHAFLDERGFDLYIDTSGVALFQRGVRQAGGEAPLRENLAAGILKLAGWTPGVPLLDPMCGSGTFLIEAAQIALNIAPGARRSFAFEKLTNFQPLQWTDLKRQAIARQLPVAPSAIHGSDLSNKVLDVAKANLKLAGVQDAVHLKQVNLVDVAAPSQSGVLVTNPPYGVRMSDLEELATLYPKFGDVLKRKFAGWRAYLFTADRRLPKLIGLSTSRKIPLFNGGLECRLYEFKLFAGSKRQFLEGTGAGDESGRPGLQP